MHEFLCMVSVMGRCQCVETSCLVPPGGDSREQGDHVQLHFVQEEEGKEEDMNRKILFIKHYPPRIKERV